MYEGSQKEKETKLINEMYDNANNLIAKAWPGILIILFVLYMVL